MRRALGNVDLLYLVAAVLFVATLAISALTSGTDETGLSRSASVLDEGPGGSAVLRRWLDGLGIQTRVLSGDRFAPDVEREKVVFVLGATEPLTPADVSSLRDFASSGGTVVVATEAGATEALLLNALGVRLTAFAPLGELDVVGALASATGARTVSVDRARELDLGSRGLPVARSQRGPVAAAVREGSGAIFVVGSLAPFLSGQIGDAQNGRFVLALADAAIRSSGAVAFDEYHHGAHPAPDVLAILERTWPGRALLVAGALVLLYVVLTGRRLGPALPLEHRPARSSLDHVRAFAGLVRRSGHGEIARERLRHDLRAGIARAVGMDPRAPAERLFGALAHASPERAAEARDVDALLARPLRDGDLLRTVRRIDELVRSEDTAGVGGGRSPRLRS
ncbi:MAG: DUF4350 domain-containing protein [Chloroflexi bacterium]|nr:DUF4350 domain-containing protein [Chloroflexota bacterium]